MPSIGSLFVCVGPAAAMAAIEDEVLGVALTCGSRFTSTEWTSNHSCWNFSGHVRPPLQRRHALDQRAPVGSGTTDAELR